MAVGKGSLQRLSKAAKDEMDRQELTEALPQRAEASEEKGNPVQEEEAAKVKQPETKRRGRKKKTEVSASSVEKQPAADSDAAAGGQTGRKPAVRSKIICALPDYLL